MFILVSIFILSASVFHLCIFNPYLIYFICFSDEPVHAQVHRICRDASQGLEGNGWCSCYAAHHSKSHAVLKIAARKVTGDWKKKNIMPVFKKGRKKDPEYYWPVRFTSLLIRTWKRSSWKGCVWDRKVIRNSQHGFKKG